MDGEKMEIKTVVFWPLVLKGTVVVRKPREGDWFLKNNVMYYCTGKAMRITEEFPIYIRTEEMIYYPMYEWVDEMVEKEKAALDTALKMETKAISEYAVKVSPEQLCQMLINYCDGKGEISMTRLLSEAKRLLDEWAPLEKKK